MKKENKNFAERALKQLLVGSQLDGFQFGIGPGIVRVCFTHYSEQDPDILWLNIEVRKIAVTTNHERLKSISKENLKELDDEDSFQLFLKNRREKVKDVWLGEESPHLYISLESGKILYVNGHDENYECWQLGDQSGYGDGNWLIVAVPGNEIATWSPEEFT
ncbi:hypothetical protein BBI15_10575 [Planococcus plakortidis]|uniref:Uncharacterized protein n=1 Tax=Planococcus plakortidis TaxID=1038856 RepID=A0A1C7EA60_9BACL|nr:hypothetical protein [Planococcus plakortidis]ANU20629.1 hypothetical protein BBI15_10575 [Planococcus plakortidis]